jgi:hypothetical protein
MEREEEEVAGRKVMPPRPPGEFVLKNTCKQHKNINKTNTKFDKLKQCCGSGSGIRCFFDPWIRIRDEQPGSYFRELKKQFFGLKYLIKFFYVDPGSGMEKNSNPGWKKVGSGINIPDPQH